MPGTSESNHASPLPQGHLAKEEAEKASAALREAGKKKSDALAFLCIGSICLILGIVFYFLSFRYNYLRERVFLARSLEFYLCLACFLAALVSYVFMAIDFLKSGKQKRRAKEIQAKKA